MTALAGSLRGHVRALVAYGAAATDAPPPAGVERHVAVVLDDRAPLEPLGPALRQGWLAARIEPWIVRVGELPRLADAFATRIRDIQRRHRVLVGDDPFAALRVERGPLRLRLEQELRNHQIRLRRLRAVADASAQARALFVVASALAVELALVEEVAGGAAPDGAEAIARAAAARLDVPAAALAAVLDYPARRTGDVAALLGTLEAALDRAVVVVDALDRGEGPA